MHETERWVTFRAMSLRRAAFALLLASAGCGRSSAPVEREPPRALPVAVFADTGRTTTLHVEPPSSRAGDGDQAHATVWLTSVSPARTEPAAQASPEPSPDTLVPAAPPPALIVDGNLKPPLPRSQTPLAVPRGARGSVELDVRVDEQGRVSDVEWADGSRDSALVRAARECARSMRFFPAERAGRPVAVWCRQRFDFGAEQ